MYYGSYIFVLKSILYMSQKTRQYLLLFYIQIWPTLIPAQIFFNE